MKQKILSYVKKYAMLEKGDQVIVGVSGGADSVCLLLLLLELKEMFQLSLRIVHVHHGIRGAQADADQQFVEALGDRYQIPVEVIKKDVRAYAKKEKKTEEEAGRILRYEAFAVSLQKNGANKIAIAHNKNDNAETMLFHLARGSGIKGLSGIAPVRGAIIRPLLCVERCEIEEYLKRRGQPYCTDATNLEDVYSRNQIRHHLLPLLEEINEKCVEHMSQTASLLLEAQEYLGVQAERVLETVTKREDAQVLIFVERLQMEAPILQKEIIRKILENLTKSRKDLELGHVESILSLCTMEAGKQIMLPFGLRAIREYDTIRIGVPEAPLEEYAVLIDKPGRYPIPYTNYILEISIDKDFAKIDEIPKNSYTKWFDYDKICQVISLRNRRNGDYFQVNQQGGTKKLKDYLIDQKVARQKRNQIPLLADGHHIIWVIGNRISEYYKITNTTKTILKAKIIGGKTNEH
ncbi:MAG: tRNA(Ile)-lysidine synthase [Clostridiales bacterium]|nr:tRNA(Ile)-lysidine synthase [Clostridiales bacterium]